MSIFPPDDSPLPRGRAAPRFLLPAVESARAYTFGKLRRDVLAGLTVAVVEVPQAMAYAVIAGVPPQYGLYTSIIQGVIGGLLSSSNHITSGPTNTQALLVASAVTRLADPADAPQLYLQLVTMLALLKGLMLLVMAVARFGDLLRYVSRSVIVGLSAGAGVLIIAGQLAPFLGIVVDEKSRWPGVIGTLRDLLPRLGEAQFWPAALGCVSLAVILVARLVSPLAPGSLLAVLVGGAIVAATGAVAGPHVLGALPAALPSIALPLANLDQIRSLLPGAAALAVVGIVETVAIAKTLGGRTGERVSADQEFFSQGMGNAVSAFFQCMPGSASFSRSALDLAAGAQTRFATVFNATFVAAIFLLFGGLARHIPTATLAAVLIVIAVGLIDWPTLRRIGRTSRGDLAVAVVTFAATLLAPLEYAVFIGIFLNIALYLRRASKLHLAEVVPTAGGPFLERPILDRSGERQVVFLQLEGELFFGVADELQDQLAAVQRSGARVVILRLKRTHSIDATVLHVLETFAAEMRRRGGHVLLCGVRDELMRRLKGYGLIDQLGRENVFAASIGVWSSAKRALKRARELVGRSIDETGFEDDEEADDGRKSQPPPAGGPAGPPTPPPSGTG